MAKPDKTTRKKTKSSRENNDNNSFDGKENTPQKNKSKVKKVNPDDAIGMSKQLAMKRISKTRSRKSNSEQKTVLNGKPMPSLADLEKMFEDSDEESSHDKPDKPKTPDAVKTPFKQTAAAPEENKLLSPSTVKKIADRMLDIISNIPDPTELLPEAPRPAIVPPKKRKKPDVPYIVGCKDRPQVIKKPNTNFCKGDSDYGVENNSEPEDESPKKRCKKSKIGGFSKSIFNAHTDEIVEMLRVNDDNSASSSDSSKTVAYDFNKSIRSQTFSPLPSTSHDRETIFKNDELFNESITVNNTIDLSETCGTKEDEVQIIEVPCETINLVNIADSHISLESREVTLSESNPQVPINDDDCCVILESTTENEQKHDKPNDEYALVIDSPQVNFEEDEIIDVDSLIAQNSQIIKKNQENNRFSNIIEIVDTPNNSEIQILDDPTTNANTTDAPPDELHVLHIPDNNDHPTTSNNVEVALGNLHNNINNMLPTAHVANAMADNPHERFIQDIVSTFVENNKNRIASISNTGEEAEFIKKNTDYFLSALPNGDDAYNEIDFREIINTTMNYFLPSSQNQATNNIVPLTTNNFVPLTTNNLVPLTTNNLRLFDLQRSQGHIPNSSSTLCSVASISATQHTIADRNVCVQPNFGGNEAIVLVASTPKQTKSKKNKLPNPLKMIIPDSPQLNTSRNLGDCPICMDSLSSNAIASTICGHVFCLKCIQAAIKSSGKRCPTCRKVLKGNGYHPLFL